MPEISPRIAAVVLCAGGASRWQESAARAGLAVSHKLLAPLRGRTVVEWSIEHAKAARFDATIVVTGAVSLPLALVHDPALTIVANPDWADGQAGSLALALDRCLELDVDIAVCGLGDQPFIEAEAWSIMGRTPVATPIAVATYDGKRRNPVRLAAETWPLIPRTGDEGARPLLRKRPEWVTELACPGNPIDIDTVEDLLSWS
jgi:CTP:molybdopterin cytidylyltransferase MocA